MPRQNPDGGDGGGGGAPSPPDQAAAAIANRASAAAARATVKVFERDLPDELGTGPLKFEGAGLSSSWDEGEQRAVVTVHPPVLFGTAAARPATPAAPCLYIATDSGAHSSWDGTTWRTI
jgi:ubiquitin